MIKIRAHHLLCIPRFKGGAYNKKIRAKIFSIQKKISKNPNIKIKVIACCDEVCDACPFRKKEKCAKKQGINYKITAQDYRVLNNLSIKENKIMKAKNIFDISINKITNKDLYWLCDGCDFLDSCLKHGLNKSFINNLK